MLQVKQDDYVVNASLMPPKARLMNKAFARFVGTTAGRTLESYRDMYEGLDKGIARDEVKDAVRRTVAARSKVSVHLPFSDPRQARICGMAAMSYAGFFDAEVDLHAELFEDIDHDSIDDVITTSHDVAESRPAVYAGLLDAKAQAIYDFSVLMGIEKDKERFNAITAEMPSEIADYFTMVSALHRGRMGISWPLPFKRFSGALREGLYRDSISYAVQEGAGVEKGFLAPQKPLYEQIIAQVKSAASATAREDASFLDRLKPAAALPATLFYLSGMQAYAHEMDKDIPHHVHDAPDVLGALISGTLFAKTTANDEDEFLTTCLACFTTLK